MSLCLIIYLLHREQISDCSDPEYLFLLLRMNLDWNYKQLVCIHSIYAQVLMETVHLISLLYC